MSAPTQHKRTRGLGSLILRGRIWRIRFSVNGRRVDQSSGSPKRSVAVKLLKQRLAELSTGRFAPNADRVTVGDLFTMLAADGVAKGNRSRRKLTHLCDAFDVAVKTAADGTVTYTGGWRATALTTDRIRAYEAERLGTGAARATVNQELAALRHAFTLAVEAGRLATKPVIKTPDPKNARTGFFEEVEVRRVMAALPVWAAPVFEFLWRTGWRVEEVLSRQWQHVDWKAGEIRLEPGETKNGNGRTFPFSVLPALKTLVERQLASGEPVSSPWVFHAGGQRIAYERFNEARRRAVKAARCPDRITHDLRRTAVRNLERAGVPRSVAMKLTGHETEAVYRRYAIADGAALREGVEKLVRAQVGYTSGAERE